MYYLKRIYKSKALGLISVVVPITVQESKGDMMVGKQKSNDNEYIKDKNGVIQYNKLREIIDETKIVLEFLSDTASTIIMGFYFPKIFCIDTSNFSSAIKTLENILFCSERAAFSDANVLLRKYRDDLFQYLYFLKIQIDSVQFILEQEKMPVKMKNRCSAIYAWHSNEFTENPKHELKNYIRAIEYKDLLQSDKEIKRCCDTFFSRVWEDIDKNANDYVHANSRKCVQDNFIDTFDVRKRCLEGLTQNIKIVSIYFISLLLLTNSSLFMSSDYIDCLDFNQQPPDGSQYWIASIYQTYFDKYISELSPELLGYLRENNSHGMKIN